MCFLHQDSKPCKYDTFCERDFCMFKHKKNEDHPKVVLETIGVIDISETGSECGDIEGEIDGETEIIENDCDETMEMTLQMKRFKIHLK
jgi:hypothetical protein